MKNPKDSSGALLCPACSRAFIRAEAVVRVADCMVHIECAGAVREARGLEAPTDSPAAPPDGRPAKQE